MTRINKCKLLQLSIMLLPFVIFGLESACASSKAKPGDDTVSLWVRQALLNDSRVSLSDVNVQTISGIVTLKGKVANLAEKEFAEKEAKKIDGVQGVINELAVKTTIRPDEEIARNVRYRIDDFMADIPDDLSVECADGSVFLKGRVDSWSQKEEAGVLASEVSGVSRIHNDLKVTYPTSRPDSDIRPDVLDTLYRDVYLVGLPINVDVVDGVVTLTGRVGSSYEKEKAEQDAYMVWNVKAVHNELAVKAWDDEGVRQQRTVPTNEELKKAVREELIQDLRLTEPYDISVEAESGHVTLRGSVFNNAQKRVAKQDAQNVVGVGWVSNFLAVSTDIHDDQSIQEKVKATLDSDYALWNRNLWVTVKNGIAKLTGEVHSYFEKEHAADVASRIKGVLDTLNDIRVKRPEEVTDAALKARIEERISTNWETRAVCNDIHVRVENDVAFLTGQVNTWGERSEADRLAVFTKGVRDVDDRIVVKDTGYPWNQWNQQASKEVTHNG